MNIEHISISRKGVWETCRQQYKFKYHQRIPEGPEPFYLTYGKIIHTIAETYVENRGKYLLNEIASDVLNGKLALEEGVYAPPLPTEYKEKLPKHIRAIEKLTDKIGTDGLVEYHFKYDLDPPNNKFVTGFIDRIINRNGKFFLIDYKTTKKGFWRKTPQTIVHDLQLRCYARVVQTTFDIPAENIKAALFYLEGEELVCTKFSEASLKSAEQELLKAYRDIENTAPEKAWGNVGDHCSRCSYRKICPFYALT